ncbi:MAG: hypothetical protein R3B70_23455 [Polyangiaceae bacterium]
MSRALWSFTAAATAAASLFVAGCATHYIPNTDVEDTDDNRKVVTFCEKYRHAVELKDVGELVRLASPDYYEDGGNVDAADDLDYAGLKEYLASRFGDARAIRYEIRYRRVLRQQLPQKDDGDPTHAKDAKGQDPLELIFVDYTYSASYRIPAAKGGDEWRRRVEDNRLEILRYPDDTFLIVAGM